VAGLVEAHHAPRWNAAAELGFVGVAQHGVRPHAAGQQDRRTEAAQRAALSGISPSSL
jgi:hypothetical protein